VLCEGGVAFPKLGFGDCGVHIFLGHGGFEVEMSDHCNACSTAISLREMGEMRYNWAVHTD
jgi:hypothetical protein